MAGIRNPIVLFNATVDSAARLAEFERSFIMSDIAKWGPDKVEHTLSRTFQNLTWKVTIFDEEKYLIQAPTKDWAQSMTRSGTMHLDGVKFPIVLWEPKFSEGKKLTSLLVKIWGYPHLLWQWFEVDRMLNPLGAVLLEMSPPPGQRCDNRYLRARIGVCDRELIPHKHWMIHRDTAGYVSCFDVYFEIKTEKLVAHSGLGNYP